MDTTPLPPASSAPTPPPNGDDAAAHARPRWPALVAFALIALALTAIALAVVARARHTAPKSESAAGAGGAAVAAAASAKPTDGRWKPVPATAGLAGARAMALISDGALATDGTTATLQRGRGQPQPLEASVPIPRVFAAAGRLFAAGQNDGAPFLIALVEAEAMVVPMPCAAAALAGAGELFVAACDDGDLAISRDGARTFGPSGLGLSAPADAGEDLARAIEAVDVDGDGGIAVAAAQRWTSDAARGQRLLWTTIDLGLRVGGARAFRFSRAPGLVHVVGLRLLNGALLAAGLEVALGDADEGVLRPRFFRAAESAPAVPMGVPGPSCGGAGALASASGVMLGPREAAFLCDGRVAVTVDGGQSWSLEELPGGRVDALDGGAMRLVARAGGKLYERRFPLRSPSGATALVLPAAELSPQEAPEPPAATPPPGGGKTAAAAGKASAVHVREPQVLGDGGIEGAAP